MATEQILISLKLDTASKDRIEKSISTLRAKAKKMLGFVVTINKGETEKELKKVLAAIIKFRPKIEKALTFDVKINTNNQTMRMLQASLNTMGQSIQNFNINAKTLSTGLKNASSAMFSAGRASNAFSAANRKGVDANKKFSRATDEVTSSFFGYLAAAAIGKTVVQTLLSNFAEFETRLIRVGRLVGLNGQDMFDFGEALNSVANELGVSTNQTIELAEAAAKLGVRKNDLVEFTRQASKIAVALQITGVEAAESFRSLSLLFQLPLTKIMNMANAINGVSDASAISAQALQHVITYIAPVMNQFDVLGKRGVAAAAALGTVLVELGTSAEVAGSGVQKLFNAIKLKANEAARAAGMPAAEFKKLIELDIVEALGRFTQGFVKLDTASQAATKHLLGLNNIRVERVLTLLGNNFDRVREKQTLATNEFDNGISVLNESARQAASLTAELQKMANFLSEIGRKAFAPFKDAIVNALDGIEDFIKENEELVITITQSILAASAFLGIIGSVSVLAFAIGQTFSTMKGQLLSVFKLFGWGISVLSSFASYLTLTTVKLVMFVGSFAKAGSAFAIFNSGLFKFVMSIAGLSAGKLAALAGSIIIAAGAIADTFVAALGQGGTALEIFENFLKIVGNGLHAVLKGVNDLIVGLFKLKLDFSGFSLGESMGNITAFDKLLGKMIYGTKEYAYGIAALRKSLVKSSEETAKLADAFAVIKQRINDVIDPVERAELYLDKFTKSSERNVNRLLAKFDLLGGGAAAFAKTYREEFSFLEEDLSVLFVTGAQGFRDVINNNLRIIEREFGQAKAAKELLKITNILDMNLTKASKIKYTGWVQDYEMALAKVNKVLQEQGVNYEQTGKVGGEAAFKLIEAFQKIRNTVQFNTVSLKDFVAGIQHMSLVQGISIERAKEMSIEFIQAGTTLEKFTDQSTEFGKAMQFSLGKENFIQNLEDLQKDVVTFGDTVVEQAKRFDLGVILKPTDAIEATQFLNKLTGEQIVQFTEVIRKKKEELVVQQLIYKAKEDADRRDETGLKFIDKQLAKYKSILKHLKLIAQETSTVEERQHVRNVEASIVELEEKRSQHITKAKDESAKLEKAALRISNYIRDAGRAMEQQTDETTKANIKIEEMIVKEQDITDELILQANSAEEIVKLRIAGAQKIAAEEYKIRKEVFKTAEEAVNKIEKSLRDLSEAGAEFLAKFQLKLEPSEIVREIQRVQLEFEKNAAEGKFVGREAEARKVLEAELIRLRKKGSDDQKNEDEKAGATKEDLLRKLDKLQRKYNKDALSQQEENQAVYDKRRQLQREGYRGQELDNALADFRDSIRSVREDLSADIADTQDDIANIDAATAKSIAARVDESAKIAKELSKSGTSLDTAFATGKEKVDEMRLLALEAGNALKDAAASLQDAAKKLNEVFFAEGIEKRVQKTKDKEKKAADKTIASIQESVDKTAKVSNIWAKLVEQINVLADKITAPEGIDVEAANKEKVRLVAVRSAKQRLAQAKKDEASEKDIAEIQTDLRKVQAQWTVDNAEQYKKLVQLEEQTTKDKTVIYENIAREFEKAGKEGAKLPADWLEMLQAMMSSVQIGQGVTKATGDTTAAFGEALADVIETMTDEIKNIRESLNKNFEALDKEAKNLVADAASKMKDKKAIDKSAVVDDISIEAVKKEPLFKDPKQLRKYIELLRNEVSASTEPETLETSAKIEAATKQVLSFIDSQMWYSQEGKKALLAIRNSVFAAATKAESEASKFNSETEGLAVDLDVEFARKYAAFAELNNALRGLMGEARIDADELTELERDISSDASAFGVDRVKSGFKKARTINPKEPESPTLKYLPTDEKIDETQESFGTLFASLDKLANPAIPAATEKSQVDIATGVTKVGDEIATMSTGLTNTLNIVASTLAEPLNQIGSYAMQSATYTLSVLDAIKLNTQALESMSAHILLLQAPGQSGLSAAGVGSDLESAKGDLSVLSGLQGQEGEAVAGLGNALGDYASLSADKTASLIAQANARTADINAANEILKSTQLTT